MSSPTFTNDDFHAALWGLMPRGRVWNRAPGSVQDQVLAGLAPTWARNSADAVNLLTDAFPATTTDLIDEWEASLGLPDPCTGPNPSIEQRRAQVVARLTNSGGQSVTDYIEFAAALGYTITITEYAPFRCGQSGTGQQLGTVEQFFVWSVNVTNYPLTYFRVGLNVVGDPLATWGDAVLECELNAIKPAHTILHFNYG